MVTNDIIILPVTQEVMEKTADNVARKYLFTHRSLMYGRTPVELLDNLFMGDLAKNAMLAYLRSTCVRQIIDYDEIRLDQFHNPDPGWDFKVGNDETKVEIKSSIPPNSEDRQSIVDKRDIKITASHNSGIHLIPPTELESEIHVQIYFYAKPYKNGFETFEDLQQVLIQTPQRIHEIINSKKYDRPLFFGWETKTNIIEYTKTLEPNTWSFGRTTRVYWRCPISKAKTPEQLVRFIDTH